MMIGGEKNKVLDKSQDAGYWDIHLGLGSGCGSDEKGKHGLRGHYPPKRMILEVRRKEKGTP